LPGVFFVKSKKYAWLKADFKFYNGAVTQKAVKTFGLIQRNKSNIPLCSGMFYTKGRKQERSLSL
jgi:hypothetical protein